MDAVIAEDAHNAVVCIIVLIEQIVTHQINYGIVKVVWIVNSATIAKCVIIVCSAIISMMRCML